MQVRVEDDSFFVSNWCSEIIKIVNQQQQNRTDIAAIRSVTVSAVTESKPIKVISPQVIRSYSVYNCTVASVTRSSDATVYRILALSLYRLKCGRRRAVIDAVRWLASTAASSSAAVAAVAAGREVAASFSRPITYPAMQSPRTICAVYCA